MAHLNPAERCAATHHPKHHELFGAGAELAPTQSRSLRANPPPSLIDTLVPELFRLATPLAHMRRTALADPELGRKTTERATAS